LLEVEETILLSDVASNQKLIKIKPVEMIQKTLGNPVDMEEKSESLVQKIDRMQSELNDLIKKKQVLIDQTKQAIEEDKKKWEIEKKQWIESAKKEGYSAGFQQGSLEAQKQYEEKLNQANLIIDATTNDYHATIEKSDDVILQLAIQVSQKILNHTLREDPSSFIEVVKSAINEIKDQSVVTINLHPVNYEFIMQHKEELQRTLEADTKLSIYIDESLSEHACLIEHPFGQIDASIDTQLLKIREVLQDYVTEKSQ